MGDLEKLIKREKLSPLVKLSLLMGVAAGMGHLHAENILHCDLAARNILVTKINGVYHAKLTDFGLSKRLTYSLNFIDFKAYGPIKWMSPESLLGDRVTTKSDVYSFGVVLWEIFTEQTPYESLGLLEAGKMITHGHTLPISPLLPVALNSVINSCWIRQPENRPSFTEIYEALKDIFDKGEALWKDKGFAASSPERVNSITRTEQDSLTLRRNHAQRMLSSTSVEKKKSSRIVRTTRSPVQRLPMFSMLPESLVLQVLKHVDLESLRSFSMVNKQCRDLATSNALWGPFCHQLHAVAKKGKNNVLQHFEDLFRRERKASPSSPHPSFVANFWKNHYCVYFLNCHIEGCIARRPGKPHGTLQHRAKKALSELTEVRSVGESFKKRLFGSERGSMSVQAKTAMTFKRPGTAIHLVFLGSSVVSPMLQALDPKQVGIGTLRLELDAEVYSVQITDLTNSVDSRSLAKITTGKNTLFCLCYNRNSFTSFIDVFFRVRDAIIPQKGSNPLPPMVLVACKGPFATAAAESNTEVYLRDHPTKAKVTYEEGCLLARALGCCIIQTANLEKHLPTLIRLLRSWTEGFKPRSQTDLSGTRDFTGLVCLSDYTGQYKLGNRHGSGFSIEGIDKFYLGSWKGNVKAGGFSYGKTRQTSSSFVAVPEGFAPSSSSFPVPRLD